MATERSTSTAAACSSCQSTQQFLRPMTMRPTTKTNARMQRSTEHSRLCYRYLKFNTLSRP
eukprot:612100-Pleurochrysis_carterae.AAC.1